MDGEGDELDDFTGDDELSIEQQARARGWKPLEEFTGPPGRWRSAAEFVRYGNEDNSVLREEVRRLSTQNNRLETQLTGLVRSNEEQAEAILEMRNLARTANERGYQRALADLQADRKSAVEEGDVQRFEQLDQQVLAMEKERAAVIKPAEPPPPPPPPQQQQQIAPEIIAFTQANPWFINDKELNTVMVAHFQRIEVRYNNWPIEDKLEEAKRLTAADFPQKAAIMGVAPTVDEEDEGEEPAPPPRRAAPVGRPGGSAPRPRRDPQGWAQITDPAERATCQAAFERIKKGDPEYTVEEYLAVYNDPHADVLALRKKRSA